MKADLCFKLFLELRLLLNILIEFIDLRGHHRIASGLASWPGRLNGRRIGFLLCRYLRFQLFKLALSLSYVWVAGPVTPAKFRKTRFELLNLRLFRRTECAWGIRVKINRSIGTPDCGLEIHLFLLGPAHSILARYQLIPQGCKSLQMELLGLGKIHDVRGFDPSQLRFLLFELLFCLL